jgi:hypothetical protein
VVKVVDMLLREILEDPVAEAAGDKVASEQLNLHNQVIQEHSDLETQAQEEHHKLTVVAEVREKLAVQMVKPLVVMVKQFLQVFQIQELF